MKLTMRLGVRSYDIIIKQGGLSRVGQPIKPEPPRAGGKRHRSSGGIPENRTGPVPGGRARSAAAGRGDQEPGVLRPIAHRDAGARLHPRRRGAGAWRRRCRGPCGLCRGQLYAGRYVHQLPHHDAFADRFLHRRKNGHQPGRAPKTLWALFTSPALWWRTRTR